LSLNPIQVPNIKKTQYCGDADPDPVPTFHFDADPDPDPIPSFTHSKKSAFFVLLLTVMSVFTLFYLSH
jgi:hypothetical protein